MEKIENLGKKLPEGYGTGKFDFEGEELKQKIEKLNKTIEEINKETSSNFKLKIEDVSITEDGHYMVEGNNDKFSLEGLKMWAISKDEQITYKHGDGDFQKGQY